MDVPSWQPLRGWLDRVLPAGPDEIILAPAVGVNNRHSDRATFVTGSGLEPSLWKIPWRQLLIVNSRLIGRQYSLTIFIKYPSTGIHNNQLNCLPVREH